MRAEVGGDVIDAASVQRVCAPIQREHAAAATEA
jgi:hypothetical protein